jgi:hypothetical protein
VGKNRQKYGSKSEPVFYKDVVQVLPEKRQKTGIGMFVLRSLFWLTALTLLLPPAADGQPAPRVSAIETFYAARVLLQDVTGVCERNPAACATSREALELMSQKFKTGTEIVSAGIAAGGAISQEADHGTLMPSDLEPAWTVKSVPDSRASTPAS